MPILTQSEINDIIADVREIIADDVISTTITYKMAGVTVSSWNPVNQTIPAMYTETGVSAFKGSYTQDEVNDSEGRIEIGDVKFIIMENDVSGVLSTDDRIFESAISNVQSATTYEIIGKSRDPLGICYFLQCRAV